MVKGKKASDFQVTTRFTVGFRKFTHNINAIFCCI